MLVLNRKIGEQVMIGNEVTVTVVGIRGDKVRLGINAPQALRVLRTECRPKTADELIAEAGI